jgi:hypothetical protein
MGTDTVSGAGPYTHTLTLLNTGDPASLTLTLFDNLIATARRIAGAQVSEVTLKWATKGKLTMQAKGIGKIADTVAKPTEAFSAAAALLGWQYTANVGGANTRMEEGTLTLKRDVQPIYGGAGNAGHEPARHPRALRQRQLHLRRDRRHREGAVHRQHAAGDLDRLHLRRQHLTSR